MKKNYCQRFWYQFCHLSTRASILIILFLLVATKLISMLSLNNWPVFKKKADPCIVEADLHQRLYHLVRDVSMVFNEFGIVHWLHYGSLIGALRYRAILPWDDDIDLALTLDSLRLIDQDQLTQRFQELNIHLEYSYWGGFFKLSRHFGQEETLARIDAMIYKLDDAYWMNRVGVERYLFWLNYRHWHRFPRTLVEDQPLPLVQFGPLEFPVPHEGCMMLPYLFSENWWLEQKPKSCIKEFNFVDDSIATHQNKKNIYLLI